MKPSLSAIFDINEKTKNLNLTPVFLRNQRFRYESERQKTFAIWPLKWLDGKILALTGMFFTGIEDRTECFFCDVTIGKWEYGDDPVKEHLRWSPNCPLLGRRVTNNVECNIDLLNRKLPPFDQNICGVGVTAARFKQYPDYSILNVRLATYSEWPSCVTQKPKKLAEAGFYYTGIGDRVFCFSCEMGLKDWEPEDDPWEQHANWMPFCSYVRLVKGKSFIEGVKNNFENLIKTTKSNTNEMTVANLPSAPSVSKIDDNKLCKICFEMERNTVYVPCGHVLCCTKCALCTNVCPVCRSSISNAVRLYFS